MIKTCKRNNSKGIKQYNKQQKYNNKKFKRWAEKEQEVQGGVGSANQSINQ